MANNITKERLLEIFDINIDTGIIRWKKPTHGRFTNGDIVGWLDKRIGYWKIGIDGKRFLAHRIIWFVTKGYWPKNLDHKDTNKLNNAISNLREATDSQNKHNTQLYKNNTSGYKGVVWSPIHQKWIAQTFVKTKYFFLGLYHDKHDAARAYNEAAIKYHGEYARLNVINELD